MVAITNMAIAANKIWLKEARFGWFFFAIFVTFGRRTY
jgi:hypothetical protein